MNNVKQLHFLISELLFLLIYIVIFGFTIPVHARHVRIYCFMSDDSLSVYEDSCVRLSIIFDQNYLQAVVNITNKTNDAIYLRGFGSSAVTNGENSQMVELNNQAVYTLPSNSTERIHGWTNLVQLLNKEVVSQGKCRNFFEWSPGHKGYLVSQTDGSLRRFKKGLFNHYTLQTTPLCLTAKLMYATSKNMEYLQMAEACLYVSDIAIGRRHRNIKEDEYIATELYGRKHFFFDSGGCDALPYVGGVVLKSTCYATFGLIIIVVKTTIETIFDNMRNTTNNIHR